MSAPFIIFRPIDVLMLLLPVQALWSPRGPKMALLYWLGISPLQQCRHFMHLFIQLFWF